MSINPIAVRANTFEDNEYNWAGSYDVAKYVGLKQV